MNTHNSDARELAKFSELAHRWWDHESEFRPLHEINPLRLGWIETRTSLCDTTVLDIGCGGGILSESMAARGAKVTGIDLSEKALAVAKLHLLESHHTVDYQLTSAESLARARPESFDLVTCMEMLEHVPDPRSVVDSCARLVKPGGWVFFSTINRNAKAYLFAVLGAEYVLKLLPKGTHDYRKFLKPSELSRMATQTGLSVQDLTGLTYNPLSKAYRLVRDPSVNYLLAARKN